MKTFISTFLNHKDLYFVSITFGGVVSAIMNFIINYTPREIFGISLGLWFVIFFINMIDIRTGIKADTKRKNDEGLKFEFESKRGWRAIEKIVVFTVTVYTIYQFEKEVIRLELWESLSFGLMCVKLGAFAYVALVEMQSIGENDKVRFGKKGQIFIMIDNVIHVVNEGILTKLKSLFNIKQTEDGQNIN